MVTISISKEYTTTPGARYISDGPHSGEEFRKKFLEKYFESSSKESITINLDGTEGYGTSLLEEAFGGLARKYGSDVCIERLQFVSEEEPLLIDEIVGYINDAKR